jgi:hypothetical protein
MCSTVWRRAESFTSGDASNRTVRSLLLELIADGNRLGRPVREAELIATCERGGYHDFEVTRMLRSLVATRHVAELFGVNGPGITFQFIRKRRSPQSSQENTP